MREEYRDSDIQTHKCVSMRDGEREGSTQSEQGAVTVKLLK